MMKDLWKELTDEETAGFNFGEYYSGEQKILKPALERKGFRDVRFFMGECDSCGPLSRIVRATKDGRRHEFFYG